MKPLGIENITKVVQSMDFVCNDIRYSHEYCTMTESIILNDITKMANELRIKLEQFLFAISDGVTISREYKERQGEL